MILSSAVIGAFFVSTPVSANVDNFTFSSMEVQYDLSRQPDGTSQMRTRELLTAEFPDFPQNKGIIRIIPRTNQDGANVVLPDDSQITVTRNGIPEPIYDITHDREFFYVSTGTEEYILGTNVFRFEYTFQNIITSFPEHQELYWDVNGTGWPQSFNVVTATINLDDDAFAGFDGRVICYTGSQGSMDQYCTVDIIDDGRTIVVSADGPLFAYENLSFVIGFKPDTFVIPPPTVNYMPFILGSILVCFGVYLFIISLTRYDEKVAQPKKKHERSIMPEYLPPKNLSILMTSTILPVKYIHPDKTMSAQIISYAVRGNIKIREEEKTGLFGIKTKAYILELVSYDNLQSDEHELLSILFRNSTTVDLSSTLPLMVQSKLSSFTMKNRTRLEKSPLATKTKSNGLVGLMVVVFATLCVIGVPFLIGFVLDAPGVIFGLSYAPIFFVVIITLAITIIFFTAKTANTIELTDEGWDMRYYLLGLRDYIKLAEVDRIKFHQSVAGAERINIDDKASLVKLYEKLLPFAIIFGFERSWNQVLQIYMTETSISPAWYVGTTAFSSSSLSSITSGISSSVSSSMGSSSSGSGFSGGGGGGGGSGGGGGGGGGGGR